MKAKIVLSIAFLAFIIRLSAIFLLDRHITPERCEYDSIASGLLQQRQYLHPHHNTIYRSFGYPAYPFLCAAIYLFTNYNYFILEIFQIILSAITCYFIYLIAKKIYNERVGLLSLFLAAAHPGLIVYSTKLHELTLVVFLAVVIFWLIISLDWTRTRSNILTGAMIGIGTLTRPSIIFFLPVHLAYLWLSSKRPENIFKPFVTSFMAAMLFITFWTIRNYGIHKKIIFITTYSGENFWQGNNQFASGSSLTKDGRPILEVQPAQFRERLYKMSEIEQYDFFYKEGFQFIKTHPAFFIKMSIKKFFYFWWFSPQAGKLYPRQWTVIYKLYYGVLFTFYILGSWLSINKFSTINKTPVFLLFILFFLISLSQSLYYVDLRHRWAVEPLMLIVSAYGFCEGPLARFRRCQRHGQGGLGKRPFLCGR